MLLELIQTLEQAKLETTPLELAEALLLARFLPGLEPMAETSAADATPTPTVSDDTLPAEQSLPPSNAAPETARPPLQTGDAVLPQAITKEPGPGAVAAVPFRSPQARALPAANKIASALRPLRRRHPSARSVVMDEEATVQQIADGGPKTVVWRPRRERWLSVELVLDESLSMHIWRPTLREFRRLLERHGAFGYVGVWQLNADEERPRLWRQMGAHLRPAQPAKLLRPAERQLVIVVSDCSSKAWYHGAPYQWLTNWARQIPTVLVQVLPRPLWLDTSMIEAEATMRAQQPGARNSQLSVLPNDYAAWLKKGAPLPVVTLDEWSIAPWAKMVAGISHSITAGMVIPDLTEALAHSAPLPQPTRPAPPDAAARVKAFAASPLARELAGYLAAAPLSLPVMRLVQQAMLPQSRQSHLAEIFRSELVNLPTPTPSQVLDDDAIFDFHEGVRDELLRDVSRRDTLFVLRKVEDFIRERCGQTGEFGALVAVPEGVGMPSDAVRVDPLALAFARIGAHTLRKLGVRLEQAEKWESFVQRYSQPPSASPMLDEPPPVLPAQDESAIAEAANLTLQAQTDMSRGLYEDARAKLEHALAIARLHKHLAGEMLALNDLGECHYLINDFDQAQRCYTEALQLARETNSRANTGVILDNLGLLFAATGEIKSALQCYYESREIFLSLGDKMGEAAVEGNLGLLLLNLGNNDQQAIEHFERQLELAREVHNEQREGIALFNLGLAYAKLNQLDAAVRYHQQALPVFERIDDRGNLADTLYHLCLELRNFGQFDQALKSAQQALTLYEQLRVLPRVDELRELLTDWHHQFSPVASEGSKAVPHSLFEFDTVTLVARGNVKARRSLTARQFVEELAPNVTLEMVEVPGGKFVMGTSDEDAKIARKEYERHYGSSDWVDAEMPQHEVEVSPFFMGKFAITQAQWRVVAGWPQVERALDPEPSYFPKDKRRTASDDQRPVEQVSWEEAQEFCARLSNKTGRAYRLPTEAEWEMACRAGTTTPFAFGETITPEFVNYNGEYPYGKAPKGKNRGETVPVGSLGVANAYGLFDMHGNVWEWCQDWYSDKYYAECEKAGVVSDPSGPPEGQYRVLRGGSWGYPSYYCRSAGRNDHEPGRRDDDIGLRVVVSARTSAPLAL